MKEHHAYEKVYLGGSDIAGLTVQAFGNNGEILYHFLQFGGDGEYSAYIVDAE